MDRDWHTSYSRVSLQMTLSDLAKYSMTWGIVHPLHDSWTSCTKHQSYIGQTHEKTIQRDIDKFVVGVFKIMSCCEQSDSLIVKVTVARLLGHSQGTKFYSRGSCSAVPPLCDVRTDWRLSPDSIVRAMHKRRFVNKVSFIKTMMFRDKKTE